MTSRIAHEFDCKYLIFIRVLQFTQLVHSLLIRAQFSNVSRVHYCLDGRLFGANCLSAIRARTRDLSEILCAGPEFVVR